MTAPPNEPIDTPAGPVRKGSLLLVRSFLGDLVTGSVLAIVPDGRNGRTTLNLECGDAGRWCYLEQIERVVEY